MVHVLTVCYGCDAAVGEMAGDRRDSVVGTYAGGLHLPVCQDSNLAERRTARNPQRTESVVARHCGPMGERGSACLKSKAENVAG